MKENRIQTYLRKLEFYLWLRGLADADTLAEIENHLLEFSGSESEARLEHGGC